MKLKQLYRPTNDVISAVDEADWLNTRSVEYIDDVIQETEKKLDDALWDNDLDTASFLRQELKGLLIAKEVGEEYITSW